jgi:hypothetical protein
MKNKNKEIKILVGSTKQEGSSKKEFAYSLRNSSIPDGEILDNLGLYLSRQSLSRINFMQSLYQKIIPVHGVIMEFGVRWGQNMALFSMFRGIHEPYNYNRKIIGFDTFSGFSGVTKEDGTFVSEGDYSVTEGWQENLESILNFHESNAPIAHKKKYELVKGDATKTITQYLKDHPETIISLAYFDFDIYKPTKACLEAIIPHITKGTVIAFDELNCPEFPGETQAVKEVFGLGRYAIQRDPSNPLISYIVID